MFAVFATLALPAFAATGINKQINFQGKVVNTNGTNVTNGSYTFVFSLYTASSGGVAVWTESKSLTVTDGIFRTDLGDTTTLPGSVDFNTDNIYLGINFNSDGEMTPRVHLDAVPQAFNADNLDGVDGGSFLRSDTSDAFTSGTITFNDSTVLAIGTGNDLQFMHNGTDSSITSATGNLTINNTNTTGATIAKLGTGTSATSYQIQNSSGTALFTINGAGTLTASAFTTNGGLLYTNGSGVLSQTGAGTSTTVLHGGTTPTYGAIALATDVSGTLPVANGGTGQTTYTDGQILIGNSTGNTLTKATITGTSNQVVVTNGNGSITLSTPQDIGTASSPTFAGVTLDTINSSGTLTVNPGANHDLHINLSGASSFFHIATNGSGAGIQINRANTSDAGGSLVWLDGGSSKWQFGLLGDATDNFLLYNVGVGANAISVNSSTNITTISSLVLSSGLPVSSGGTGQTTYTNGQILIGNTTGNTLTKATITGTSNQVVVTNGAGSITLSTPQDIATGSSPQFTGLTLTGDLSVQGNTTIGDASTDTLTLNSAAWTVPNAVTWTKTAQSSAAETVQKFLVSDDTSYFQIANGTTNDSTFAPVFEGVQNTTSTSVPLSFFGTIGSSGDSGTSPAILFLGRVSGGTDVSTRPLVEFRNRATAAVKISGGYNLQLFGGTTSPTLASIAQDVVSMAGVDRSTTGQTAAGNRMLGIQGEKGSGIYFGNDRLDWAASAGYLSIAGADVATITATGLGIGTTPSSALHVVAAAQTVASASGAEYTTSTFTAPTITLTGTTQVTSVMDSHIFNPSTLTDASAVTINGASNLTINGAPIKAGSVALTNTYGLKVNAGAVSTATNSFGAYIDAQTGATNNYGLVVATGNTGFGTAAPTSLLHAVAAAQTVASASGAEYTTSTFTAPTITLTGSTQVTSQMDSHIFNPSTLTDATAITIDNAANLTINGAPVKAGSVTLTKTYGLRINAGAVSTATSSYGAYIDAQTGATNNYGLVVATGNTGLGNTAPAQKLDVTGTIRQSNATNCALTTNASGDIACTSDERLKDVDGYYTGGLKELNTINPIRFQYKNESYVHVGFSAQNIQSVLPEGAPLQGNGYLGLDSNAVIALAVNSIKQLDVRTKALEIWTANPIVSGTLTVSGASTLSQLIADSLKVKNGLVIQGSSTFGGEVSVSSSQAGFAKILKYAKSVRVVYDAPLTNTPLVQVTPQGDVGTFWIANSTATGFTLNISKSNDSDIIFGWTALTSTDPKTTISDPGTEPTPTSTPTPEPIGTPTPSPTPVETPTPEPTSAPS